MRDVRVQRQLGVAVAVVVAISGYAVSGPMSAGALAARPSGAVSSELSAPTAPLRYSFASVTPLGTNTFGTYDDPEDLNRSTHVVGGSSATHKTGRAFFYDGTTHEIGSLGTARADVESVALGINDNDAVVGSSQVDGPGDSGQHAFYWRGGTFRDLGTGYTDRRAGSYANDITNRGLIVGVHYASQSAPKRAVIWQHGTLHELPDLGGVAGPYGTDSEPLAANNLGLIVGDAHPAGAGGAHGVYWRDGVIHDLGNLGGVNEGTRAYGVNDSGEIVGESADKTGHVGAFAYQNGKMTELKFLDAAYSARYATAQAVNTDGVVVGAANLSDLHNPNGERTVATVWNKGVPTDLNERVDGLPTGATLLEALSINNSGMILVDTVLANGQGPVAGILAPER